MQKTYKKSLFWFRRDLRVADNAALYYALRQSEQVYCVFIFDRDILDPLLSAGSGSEPGPASGSDHTAAVADRRVEFILESVVELDAALRESESGLIVKHAAAWHEIPLLAASLGVDAVFANHDYEPQALARDALVGKALTAGGRRLLTYKDQVIFEKDEILTQSQRPYSVFTPYKNAWMQKIASDGGAYFLQAYPTENWLHKLAPLPEAYEVNQPSLAQMGFAKSNLSELSIATGMTGASTLLENFMERMARYDQTRNFPAIKGPSYLSVHLRFGTISIRALARMAFDAMHAGHGGSGTAVWLSELVWRDFYAMILHHNPHVVGHAFKPAYDKIVWDTGPDADRLFEAWCEGRTGYPLVDAAMLQLNHTGYMHNRLRMVTACFLIKDLGIDWRRGEAYFAALLNDFDLSSNNGGWQWASSTGCDAQPYFRIFNPVTQSEKFDAEGKFIRRYLPQLARLPDKILHAPWTASTEQLTQAGVTLGVDYPRPLVQHDLARQATLQRYAVVKG